MYWKFSKSSFAELKEDIRNHLKGLQFEIEQYLPQIDNEAIEMIITGDPYNCNVDEVKSDAQDEFLDLTNNWSVNLNIIHLVFQAFG